MGLFPILSLMIRLLGKSKSIFNMCSPFLGNFVPPELGVSNRNRRNFHGQLSDVSPAELKPSLLREIFETRIANFVCALLPDPHPEDSHSG